MKKLPPFRLLILLLGASLACQTVYRTMEVATPTPRPTRPAPRTSLPPPTQSPTPAPTLAPPAEDNNRYRVAMRPEFAGDVDQFPTATRYQISLTVDFNKNGSATLTGQERVRYTNVEDEPLADIYLMLWPNDPHQYLSEIELGAVTVDGTPLQPEIRDDRLAARIALPQPLPPGESVDISAAFYVTAYPGVDTKGARFGLTNGILLAPTFYPLIPRRIAGQWQTIPAPAGGDTTNSDSALYTWTVDAPADQTVIASGSVSASATQGDRQILTLVTGPMRDLALVVGPLELQERDLDGVLIKAYTLRDHQGYATDMLDYATDQMAILQDRLGLYPFAELDVVDAPGAFGGIEFPGLIFVGVVDGSDFFERATVHEVGHQWFYSLIGDDQLLEPWLDEAAASYTEVLYTEATYGDSAAQDTLDGFWSYVNASQNPDLPIGQAVDDYNGEDYGLIVYGKGALFFDTLRQELGDETFFAFLRAYYAQHRYGFASSQSFQATAEATCACELDDLFDLWVYKGGEISKP